MHFRSIFLSDVHLGTADARVDRLLDFLQKHTCDQLYLVGDIIDFWSLQSQRRNWPTSHSRVVSELLAIARSDTEVIYIPGNHDSVVRNIAESVLAGVKIRNDEVHVTAEGRMILVTHGDIFDEVVLTGCWKHRLGGDLYDMLLAVGRRVNHIRKLLGYPYWSLANHVKYKFADAVAHIRRYEEAAIAEAANRDLDGIICGHIHHPNYIDEGEVLYLNSGDWVEHCTAVIEDEAGRFDVIRWPDSSARSEAPGLYQPEAPLPEKVSRAA